MKASVLSLAAIAVAIAPAAKAQLNTGNTLVGNLAAFDPVPGHFTSDEMQKIEELARAVWAKNHLMTSADPVTIRDVKAWPRAHQDGVIVCATFPASKSPNSGPQVEITAVLSITGGKFPGFVVQNLFDEQAYNLVGCNTPGASAG